MKPDEPILLVKWHETANWLLDRVDGFPKNQRFIFGTRLADRTLGILELLVEAAVSPRKRKVDLLRQCSIRDYLFVRRLRECEAANKKASPAVSSRNAKGAGGVDFVSSITGNMRRFYPLDGVSYEKQ